MSASSILLAALLVVSPIVLKAQNAVPMPGPTTIPPSEAERPELLRFNLDFPGGTPGALVAAISKAIGKNLNVIIPTSHANTKIMAFKVEAVTVPQLFAAIQGASRREVPEVTSQNGRQKNITFKTVGIDFGIAGGSALNNDTVWSFTSSERTAEDATILALNDKPEQVCQYFQLAPYLEEHTIEDITTAIRTGWKMLKADPMPQLSFHQETKLLIAVGVTDFVNQIPQVLQQLRFDNSAAVDKIAKWQAEIAEIAEKKEPGWEEKVWEKNNSISHLAQVQKARETIDNPPPVLSPPTMRRIVRPLDP